MTRSKAILENGQGEITEKKSRFIAYTASVRSEKEAEEFIEKLRKEHFNAKHHCFAYVVGPENELTRCSDDGEPSGTAGKVILEAITGEDLRNACIVVVRYFGGTLLGTGGLARAYRAAAREGILASRIAERIAGSKIKMTCDYTTFGKVEYIAGQNSIPVLGVDYSDVAVLTCLVPEESLGRVKKAVEALGFEAVVWEEEERLYFALSEGSPVILV